MIPNPLHPAVVHFPLVLAVLLPFVAAVVFYLSRRPEAGRGPWIGLTVMAFLLAGSAWLSVETGQQQEDRVERVVSESVIGGHEEAAEGFLVGAAIVAAVILAGLIPGKVGRTAQWLAVPAGLVILALAFRVGDSGGKLVYQYGAASAYVGTTGGASPGVVAPGERGERGEGHERGDDDDGR